MDAETVAVYEHRATEWLARRGEAPDGLGLELRRRLGQGPVADLGCGVGRYLAELGRPVVGVDAAAAMLELARRRDRPLVRADLERLPFADGVLAGAFARHSYLHLPKDRLGAALADLRRALVPGGLVLLTLIEGTYEGRHLRGDDFGGRFFACFGADELAGILTGVGFVEVEVAPLHTRARRDLVATARR